MKPSFFKRSLVCFYRKFLVMNKIILTLILGFVLASCSASKQTNINDGNNTNTVNDSQKVYVFDDISEIDTIANYSSSTVVEEAKQEVQDSIEKLTVLKEPASSAIQYALQLGAFSNEQNAKRFVQSNQTKLGLPLNVSWNEKVKLFVVRTNPSPNKIEVEKIKNNLKLKNSFNNAFIVVE